MNAAPLHLHVESTGAGPPLVLIHGFAMHGGLFAPIVPALGEHHRVHVIDLPGHGRSPPMLPFTLPALAEAIDRATAAIDAPLTVLGWSLGGQVALQWASAQRDRIARLILVSTTPSFVARDGWPDAMSPDMLGRFGDELRVAFRLTLQRFLALQVHGSDEGRGLLAQLRTRLFERGLPSPATLADAIALLMRADLRPALPRIRAAALVIGGDRDALVPLPATRALADALPSAAHVAIAGAAHAPFLSHRSAFLAALAPFLVRGTPTAGVRVPVSHG